MNLYNLTKIKQHFKQNSLTDIKKEVRKEIVELAALIKPGASIALAVGSRGIRNLASVITEIAGFIKEKGGSPFIIPAMGSHGGATAAGQSAVLEAYGISEKLTGVPVRSSMEVVELPGIDQPYRLFMDKYGYSSDGIILINRIKPHTDFHGKFESGLIKMAVIGLGKEKQASAIHSFGVYGLSVLIPLLAQKIFSSGKILAGIGLVENAYDETMLVKAIRTEELFEEEPLLLNTARENMPCLPVNNVDLLVIDRMGKDISGVGIDTNIIGRIRISGQTEPASPVITIIAVLDLTDESHGNATGVGLSDVITKKLYDKIDFRAMYTNVVTSSFLERGKVPVVASNGREAFETGLRSCGYLKENEERIIRIKDTLHLDEMYVSQPVLNDIAGNSQIEIVARNVEMFNEEQEFNPF